MKLQFWGAARTVTGSMHLVEVGGRRLLLDCGLYQGNRKQAFEINRNFPFDVKSIDAVVISHAHIDHTGNLPTLVHAGYTGPIFATDATRDLAAHMLADSARIQQSDVVYINKVRNRQGQKPFEPLYRVEDAAAAIKQFVAIGYGRSFDPIPGVSARYFDAGHMLGSASVLLEMSEGARRRNLLFSGDIGRPNTPILRDPMIVPGAELIIMESTYGDRRHAPVTETRGVLLQAAQDTLGSRGKLIIPAFAVGRTQEIVFHLNQLSDAGQLPALPVYVDSPLAANVTEVYRAHPECYDAELFELLSNSDDRNVFGFKQLRYVRSVDESKALNTLNDPAIIVAASGMCEGGRVLHHMKNHIGQSSTTVLFAGFQAQHTLGRRILDGAEIVPILGREYKVAAKIQKAEGLRSHADCDELQSWAVRTQEKGKVEQVFLVHGEPIPAETLAATLTAAGLPNVSVPPRGQVVDL